jgi:DNA repair protein RadA/Sms
VANPPERAKRNHQTCKRCEHPFRADKSKCPSCGFWNQGHGTASTSLVNGDGTLLLTEISKVPQVRIATRFLDKVLGGALLSRNPHTYGPGWVNNSTFLLAGAPGAGKSTLSLQVMDAICGALKREALYIGMEEAKEQIEDRASRILLPNADKIRLYPLGNTADIAAVIMARKPCAFVVDSIPGLMGDDLAGAVEMCKQLKAISVMVNAPCMIIDHATKDDDIAGLRALQHAVDCTATMFAVEDDSIKDKEDWIREVSILKNRDGRAFITNEFKMTATGLVAIPEFDEEEEEDDDGDDDDDDDSA